MLLANCILLRFAHRDTYEHTLRHWAKITKQEVESGQKFRNESQSARGSVCLCVSALCMCVGVSVCATDSENICVYYELMMCPYFDSHALFMCVVK